MLFTSIALAAPVWTATPELVDAAVVATEEVAARLDDTRVVADEEALEDDLAEEVWLPVETDDVTTIAEVAGWLLTAGALEETTTEDEAASEEDTATLELATTAGALDETTAEVAGTLDATGVVATEVAFVTDDDTTAADVGA